MYQMNVRIRYSETDETGRLSMSGLLRIFQDCGYFHAVDSNMWVNTIAGESFAWYLLKWHIEAYEMPPCGTVVKVGTWIYAQGGTIAHKQIALWDDTGKMLAIGDTMWACVNAASGESMLPGGVTWSAEDYGERLPLRSALARITPYPKQAKQAVAFPHDTVDLRFLDDNHHANNVRFTEYAMVLAERLGNCSFLEAEFLQQAKAGDILYPFRVEEDVETYIYICNETGGTLAQFRFADGV